MNRTSKTPYLIVWTIPGHAPQCKLRPTLSEADLAAGDLRAMLHNDVRIGIYSTTLVRNFPAQPTP